MDSESKHQPSRVAVGMSGGTDSSAVAALLVETGYEVIGLTAHMWKEGSRCCSLEDVERARRVCHALDIRHYVVNAQDRFSDRVVAPFVAEYTAGRTPSPCILCNQFIKFGFLLDRAVQLNCTALATGHYARITESGGRYHLCCARDRNKDQAYFLHRLSQRQLAHVLLPLGNWMKPDVCEYVRAKKLPVSARGESQDLCFVEEGRYPEFIEARRPELPLSGRIVDPVGHVLGEHKGIHRYTIGQRTGLGVAAKERLYVSRLDAVRNEVVLAGRVGVMARICSVSDVRWVSEVVPSEPFVAEVRPRYRHPGATARIVPCADGRVEVCFDEPQFALTPGQAAVFYQGDEILGGGWIEAVPD